MQQLALADDQIARIDTTSAVADTATMTPGLYDTEALMLRPLTEAKRLAAAEFERGYLVRVMERARGSVSGGARLAGLDRTNFRRLLQRHGLHGALRIAVGSP